MKERSVRAENEDSTIRLYILIAHTGSVPLDSLTAFADRLAEDATVRLAEATSTSWQFYRGEPHRLEETDAHYPSDFLQEAHLRMVQSPADIVLVITDRKLVSRERTIVAGLASPEANVAVISVRKLQMPAFGEPARALDAEAVRWNAAALLVHLVSHLLGLKHSVGQENVMAPFVFREERRSIPRVSDAQRRQITRDVRRVCEDEIHAQSWLTRLKFLLQVAFSRPAEALSPAMRSRAVLLPLSLVKMITGAIIPVFVFLFTDEVWWVGLHLDGVYIWTAAAAAILTASFYIPVSQKLFFPHREKSVLTVHVALLNVTIFISIFFAVVGLFVMVVLLVLLIEWWLFPADYISSWFQGRGFIVTWFDRFHLALVLSTLGTLSGALGGGLHGKDIIRELGLFLSEP